ncbi:winged helix-turn-helix transcriptional regulator [Sphingoaurantiacus capsulatus]|uniref:Winged helix-turn-helix transcriptional regulator n=1 Tax=Sphingoaurantiacus capsulatus TaxID=1771310 RepID=A0ABV7X7L6_9SPHN
MQVTTPHDETGGCADIARHLGWIGGRWTLPVIVTLDAGPLRFNQLRRAVAGISQQMLTRTLRALERDGMLTRTVHPSVPPQVEYALTDLGRSLAEQGMQLGAWVRANQPLIDAQRRQFDDQHR